MSKWIRCAHKSRRMAASWELHQLGARSGPAIPVFLPPGLGLGMHRLWRSGSGVRSLNFEEFSISLCCFNTALMVCSLAERIETSSARRHTFDYAETLEPQLQKPLTQWLLKSTLLTLQKNIKHLDKAMRISSACQDGANCYSIITKAHYPLPNTRLNHQLPTLFLFLVDSLEWTDSGPRQHYPDTEQSNFKTLNSSRVLIRKENRCDVLEECAQTSHLCPSPPHPFLRPWPTH